MTYFSSYYHDLQRVLMQPFSGVHIRHVGFEISSGPLARNVMSLNASLIISNGIYLITKEFIINAFIMVPYTQ